MIASGLISMLGQCFIQGIWSEFATELKPDSWDSSINIRYFSLLPPQAKNTTFRWNIQPDMIVNFALIRFFSLEKVAQKNCANLDDKMLIVKSKVILGKPFECIMTPFETLYLA